MNTPLLPGDGAPRLHVRDVFAAAWPLFQVSWPTCLPLALVGVASAGAPRAAAVAEGLAGAEYWGLYAASAVLTLLCYSAVFLRQHALAEGHRPGVAEGIRAAARRLPQSAATAVLLCAPLALAVALVPLSGLASGLLAIAGLAFITIFAMAWPVALIQAIGPVSALRRGWRLVRGRVVQVAGIVGAAFAAVLVFVLLSGILLGVGMSIAGMRGPTGAGQLGASRLLIAGLVSVPVVWLGAVWVTTCRWLLALSPGEASSPRLP